MSLLHTRSGAGGVKSLASRFGATGKSCLLSVVTTNFLWPRARMPCSFISRCTRSLPTRTPLASSSFHTLGQPYSPLNSA